MTFDTSVGSRGVAKLKVTKSDGKADTYFGTRIVYRQDGDGNLHVTIDPAWPDRRITYGPGVWTDVEEIPENYFTGH